MPSSAAIFDLDRTLLSGASGSRFAEALREAGLIGPALPGEGLLSGLFTAFGENLPMIALSRQLVGQAKGRSQAETCRAGERAASDLVSQVQPFVAGLLAEHRDAGRTLVLATTTPYDLVAALGARLGFDHVIATRYGVAADGTYDGTVDGHFVWSKGKKAAVSEWAAQAAVNLRDSWFYSDSIYDTPLLSAVGHPVAVNPDPRLAIYAIARRWPTLHQGFPSCRWWASNRSRWPSRCVGPNCFPTPVSILPG
jgi:putative phosphoserine phosphatase / 1-acylglycerol-3-phosphate O-acyltransferase